MLKFTKTAAITLSRKYKNAKGEPIEEDVPNGTDIIIYTKDVNSAEGETSLDLIWQIPFELWFGTVDDRETAEGQFLTPAPFNKSYFGWKVFKEDGTPTYPIVRSDVGNDIVDAIIDANTRIAELLADQVEGLTIEEIEIVGIV